MRRPSGDPGARRRAFRRVPRRSRHRAVDRRGPSRSRRSLPGQRTTRAPARPPFGLRAWQAKGYRLSSCVVDGVREVRGFEERDADTRGVQDRNPLGIQLLHQSSRALPPSALPRVAFMIWPMRKPTTFLSPPRTRSASSGLAEMTSSTTPESSSEPTEARPRALRPLKENRRSRRPYRGPFLQRSARPCLLRRVRSALSCSG